MCFNFSTTTTGMRRLFFRDFCTQFDDFVFKIGFKMLFRYLSCKRLIIFAEISNILTNFHNFFSNFSSSSLVKPLICSLFVFSMILQARTEWDWGLRWKFPYNITQADANEDIPMMIFSQWRFFSWHLFFCSLFCFSYLFYEFFFRRWTWK